jgi:hypothetical protein
MKLTGPLLAILLLGPRALSAQEVELEPGESLTVRAKDSVTVVIDSIPYPVIDTVYACPPGWTCEEPRAPDPLAGFYVAGYALPDPFEATENGLHVEWAEVDVDSIRIHGSKQDGTDGWDVMLPGTDRVYRHELFYAQVTPMEACGVAIKDGLLSDPVCDSMDWAPMVRADTAPPGKPGAPKFEPAPGDSVRVTWTPAEGADYYEFWTKSHRYYDGPFRTTTNGVTVGPGDISDGDWTSVQAVNAAGRGEKWDTTYHAP